MDEIFEEKVTLLLNIQPEKAAQVEKMIMDVTNGSADIAFLDSIYVKEKNIV